jgi:penicillin-binding protein 2
MASNPQHLKDHWQESRLFLSRLVVAGVVVLVLTGVLIGRLAQLQVLDYQRFSELSQGNRFKIEPLPPTRGLIFDRNGLVIADNRPSWQLVAVREEMDDVEAALQALEELDLVNPSEHETLLDTLESRRAFERVTLSNLTFEQAAKFAVRRHRFPGVDIQEALVRY